MTTYVGVTAAKHASQALANATDALDTLTTNPDYGLVAAGVSEDIQQQGKAALSLVAEGRPEAYLEGLFQILLDTAERSLFRVSAILDDTLEEPLALVAAHVYLTTALAHVQAYLTTGEELSYS